MGRSKKILTLLVLLLGIGNVWWMPSTAYAAEDTEQTTLPTPQLSTVVRKADTTSVIWKTVDGVTGYQIRYAVERDAKGGKIVTVKGESRKKKTLTTLKRTKNYYVWVRSYKKTTEGSEHSAWSTPCQLIAWNTGWKYSKQSKIHRDSATLYYTPVRSPKGKTICINAGHGTKGGERKKTLCHPDGSPKVTGGTNPAGARRAMAVSSGTTLRNGMSEAAATRKLAKKVKTKLLYAGYDVLMVRETSDAQLDNIARTVFANQNADCHIALHYDGTSSNKGAFYIRVPNVKSYRRMYPVSAYWKQHHALGNALIGGLKKNGIKIFGGGSIALDLTQTSYSQVPSVDLEVGDRASSTSAKTWNRVAEGIARGIDTYIS